MTPKLKELIDQLVEARNKATTGEWENITPYFEQFPRQFASIKLNEGLKTEDDFSVLDEKFTCLAANNITKLAKASLIMAQALEKVTKQTTSKEYLERENDDLDGQTCIEAWDNLIIEARQAISKLHALLGKK